MTTHRNLKPHYAEPKGKSGPVIVVKKGEVMKHRDDPFHPDNILLRQIAAARDEGVKKGEVMSEAERLHEKGHGEPYFGCIWCFKELVAASERKS